MWARKMLAEVSKLSIAELMKRAQEGGQEEPDDGEDD